MGRVGLLNNMLMSERCRLAYTTKSATGLTHFHTAVADDIGVTDDDSLTSLVRASLHDIRHEHEEKLLTGVWDAYVQMGRGLRDYLYGIMDTLYR